MIPEEKLEKFFSFCRVAQGIWIGVFDHEKSRKREFSETSEEFVIIVSSLKFFLFYVEFSGWIRDKVSQENGYKRLRANLKGLLT